MNTITVEELNNFPGWKNYKPLLQITSKNKIINAELVINSDIPQFEKFEIINDLKLLNDTERQQTKNYLVNKFDSRINTYPLSIKSFQLSLEKDNISNLAATVVYSFGKDHNDIQGRNDCRKDLLNFIKTIINNGTI